MGFDTGQITEHRLHNWLQLALIVAGLALLLAVPAWLIAGAGGVVWSLFLVAMAVYTSSRAPARMILARSGAGLLRRRQAPGLYGILDELYRRAGMSIQPVLFYVPSPQLNAFAVGDRGNGGIAVSDGLVRALRPRELAGVLAHEVSHLRHNDTRVMSMAAAMSQLTALGATFLQVSLLMMLPWVITGQVDMPWLVLLFVAAAPTASTLLQLALSRNREYTADLEAAALTGDARGLASALEILERHHGSWLESLFGRRPSGPFTEWLQTHPPTSERIRRLLELERARSRGKQPALLHSAVGPQRIVPERPEALGRRAWFRLWN